MVSARRAKYILIILRKWRDREDKRGIEGRRGVGRGQVCQQMRGREAAQKGRLGLVLRGSQLHFVEQSGLLRLGPVVNDFETASALEGIEGDGGDEVNRSKVQF